MPMKVVYANVNGELLSETRDGVRKLYIPDALGNTVALMDSTGTLTDTFSYFPSGTVASRTGTTPTPFQWVGGQGYYRDNSKRVHVRERNFNVNLGRWAETDPIGFAGGDYNLYRYVNNRFVVMTDPSGLQLQVIPINSESWRMGNGEGKGCCGAYTADWQFVPPYGRDWECGWVVQLVSRVGDGVSPTSLTYLEAWAVDGPVKGVRGTTCLAKPNKTSTPVDRFSLPRKSGSGTHRRYGTPRFVAYSETVQEEINAWRGGACTAEAGLLPCKALGTPPPWWTESNNGLSYDPVIFGAFHQAYSLWDCSLWFNYSHTKAIPTANPILKPC